MQPVNGDFVTPGNQFLMDQFADGKNYRRQEEKIPGGENRKRYEQIVKETIRDLYGNPRYWDFFKGFSEETVHDFIIEYASRRAWYVINGNYLLMRQENEQFHYHDLAVNALWEIQQKKLFNLQAEWRAGLISLPGITVTRDFQLWEKTINTCPFLEPITSREIRLYMDYLVSGTYTEKSWIYGWQDYDSYRNASDNPELLPAWYRFFDAQKGTGYLLILPDKRGNDEKKYLNALKGKPGNELMRQDHEFFGGKEPDLHVNFETLDFFIRTFESRHLLQCFLASEQKPEDSAKEAELQQAIRILRKAEGNVRIPLTDDWKDSLIKGAHAYKTLMILEQLPGVYEEYKLRIKSGIAFPDNNDLEILDEYIAHINVYRQQVEQGRKLCGE